MYGASGRALATSWLLRLLIELPLGSPALVIRPQILAHRSIHPLTQAAYTSVDVLKLKNNYTATATVYLKVCRRKKEAIIMRIVCLPLLDAKVNMSMVQAGIPNLKGILSEKIG